MSGSLGGVEANGGEAQEGGELQSAGRKPLKAYTMAHFLHSA